MRESEKNVGRADHNLEGARSAAEDEIVDKADENDDNPDLRAHGTHGRGRGEERIKEEMPSLPDEARGSDRGGSASWGSEGSGGSVMDKRPDR